jgi:hypothetical protein
MLLLSKALAPCIVSLAVIVALLPPVARPSHAAEDPCPEPNNTFQAACFLGQDSDAFGYLASQDDVDAYRIEVLDFNAIVRIELVDRPRPYRVELADWNGRVIVGSDPDGVIDTIVGPPGAYYVFVHAANGPVSASEPYRLTRTLQYPNAQTPDVLYSNELRHGARPEAKHDGAAEYSSEGSKFTIRMTATGTPEDPKFAASLWGPELSDFLLTVDTRMESEGLAGYHIFFRFDAESGYVVFVTSNRNVILTKAGRGWGEDVAQAVPKALDLEGGVNRTTIRCVGDEIQVWINGEPVISHRDDMKSKGRFGFGSATVGPPPTVIFDNILATTPGGE